MHAFGSKIRKGERSDVRRRELGGRASLNLTVVIPKSSKLLCIYLDPP